MASRSTNRSTRRSRTTQRGADRSRGSSTASNAQRRRRRPTDGRRPQGDGARTRTRRPADVDRIPQKASRGSSERNPSIDGFRSLAILSVLLYHLKVPWLPSGHLGVGMFLVLTGYLVTSSLLKRMRNGLSAIPRFWVGRLARIWPSMATMIAFVVLSCVIGNHVLLTKARPDILPGLAMFENVSYILRNVSYFEQIGGPSPLTHLWYLGIDAQFSLVWPLLMVLLAVLPSRSTARRITLAAAVASAVAMAVLYNPDVGITRVYYGPDTRAFAPLIGAWLAYVMPLGKRPARDLRQLIGQGRFVIEIAAIVSFLGLVVGMAAISDTSALLYRGGMFVAALLSAVVLASLVLPGGILSLLLSFPPLTWLGSRSFGVYLWHYPLIQLFGATRNDVGWWTVPLVVVLSLVLGELSYQLIEQPLGRLVSGGTSSAGRVPAARGPQSAAPFALTPVTLACAAVLGITVIADGVGLALIEPETLVPEDAIVSTGEDAGHAMDLSAKSKSKEEEQAPAEPAENIPPADAVLHAPAEEKEAGIYDPVLIGDSVPGDAEAFFDASFPDGLLDSYIGRRPDQAVTVLDEYLAQGVVGNVVILQAFSNTPCTREELDHMIQACGDRSIYIVNVQIPEIEEEQINQTLAAAAAAYDNVELIDWHGLSADSIDWLYPDGEHLTPTGQPIYINMLVEAIYETYTDYGGTITRRNEAGTSTSTEMTTDSTATDTSSDSTSSDTTQTTDGSTDAEGETGMVIGDSAETEQEGTTQPASMRILMLGNSFTYYNNMPAMLADLTNAEVVTHARGGAILAEQLDKKDQMGSTTLATLKKGGWDYVVIQEKSSRPIRDNADDYQNSARKLCKLVRAAGATPVLYTTWPYNEDAGRLHEMGLTREEMDEQLQAAYKQAADSTGAIVADVGTAFATADSHELLYAGDGVHPSVIGSKLAAEVIAKAIEDDHNQRTQRTT